MSFESMSRHQLRFTPVLTVASVFTDLRPRFGQRGVAFRTAKALAALSAPEGMTAAAAC